MTSEQGTTEHDELSAERLIERIESQLNAGWPSIQLHPAFARLVVRALRDRDRLAAIVARNTCECGHELVDHTGVTCDCCGTTMQCNECKCVGFTAKEPSK